jgi:xylulokinase
MLLLGIDVGTSSIKVTVLDGTTGECLAQAGYPETESPILAPRPGWAEQSPLQWWSDVQQAIAKANASGRYNPKDIRAIGIAYQMHGLVVVDKEQQPLYNSIIWCDSRAVETGDKAFDKLGHGFALEHLLNSPGNFTASKLAWLKQHEPDIYERIDAIMLPGDFIAMQLTGQITTSASALSEGVFWDFKREAVSAELMQYFGFKEHFIREQKKVFDIHGELKADVADQLGLSAGIPVGYKAGDQPNNALSLGVLKPGEVAATAGTSGVIYAVTDQLVYDRESRVNSFAHVNHTADDKHIGVLLCINGTGSINRWVKHSMAANLSYNDMNAQAATVPPGSEGLLVIPFGNGAERMLNNKLVGAHLHNIDLNIHTPAHVFRATQEGIACAFRYGLDIMRENGIDPSVIRAGKANMFLSSVFTQAFVNTTGVKVELYDADGSVGAAIGAGIGAGLYKDPEAAFAMRQTLAVAEPDDPYTFENHYQQWKQVLLRKL